MLKEISNDEDVLEVTGEYTGSVGEWGASHERKHTSIYNNIQNYNNSNSNNYSSKFSSMTLLQQQQVEKEEEQEQKTTTITDKLLEIKMVYKGLQTLFEAYLPKADATLIHDLLVQRSNKIQMQYHHFTWLKYLQSQEQNLFSCNCK